MIAYLARGIAALGAALGAAAIWVEFGPGGATYWDSPHHAVGITMLVLVILAGIGIFLAAATRLKLLDHLWLIPGLVLGGFCIFLPITVVSTGNGSALKAGAWLGVAAAGVFAVAAVVNAIPVPEQSAGYAPVAPAAAPGPAPAAPQEPEPAPAAQPEASASPPADWYPDPTGQARLRYWDGNQWTDSTSA